MSTPVDGLSNEQLLLRLLTDLNARGTFREFLDSIYSPELFDCWNAIEEYRRVSSLDERRKQGRVIFEQFLAEDAPDQVNHPNVKLDHDASPPEMFDRIQQHIFRVMQRDVLMKFRRSTLWPEAERALSGRAPSKKSGGGGGNGGGGQENVGNDARRKRTIFQIIRDLFTPGRRVHRTQSRDEVPPTIRVDSTARFHTT